MIKLFRSVTNYFSLVKFSHTVFAMPFALIGFSLAVTSEKSEFSFRLLLLIILCMIFARNAAMGFNRVADKKFDSLNPRTKDREIPAGLIKTDAATAFVVLNAMLFIATTAFINRLTLWLSPVALLIILGYSLTKRFTSLCHFILGLGLSLAPIGAYISVPGSFSIIPIIYSVIVLTWVSGFDIIYSLQDEEFDKSLALHSIPSLLGKVNALRLSSVLHVFSAAFVIVPGYLEHFSWMYWIGVAIFCGMLVYQHRLVKPNDLSKVNLAFMTTNGVASICFSIFFLLDYFLF